MLQEAIVPKLAFNLLKEAERYYLNHHKLSDAVLTELSSVFGHVLAAATELLDNCKITQYQTTDKYRSIYKVGTNMERYTIYNDINFCQCQFFQSQVLEDKASVTCKHVLALKLNQITNCVKVWTETVTDSQFVEFLNEQLNFVNDQ
ncbi:hypothetical protein Zmor_018483 [Zophobas morio]|uniref:SWIM-type domain-containing protein n=2 Tax=Zophobas morio TaxID=2755281 RepID=A0AA38IEH1_9CUCU|nr:hypothetical protein Zmor_018483 [Zophobas morio]